MQMGIGPFVVTTELAREVLTRARTSTALFETWSRGIATSTKGIHDMSLTLESPTDICPLSLTEIRMRVANIKARWSDDERAERAVAGERRRRSLQVMLGEDEADLLHTVLADGFDQVEAGV